MSGAFRKTINVDTYCCKVAFHITPDIDKEFSRISKANGYKEELTISAEGLMIAFDLSKYYILISSSFLSHNTISHEIFHAVSRIADDRNIEEEESKAWLMGYVTQEIHKFISDKKLQVRHG